MAVGSAAHWSPLVLSGVATRDWFHEHACRTRPASQSAAGGDARVGASGGSAGTRRRWSRGLPGHGWPLPGPAPSPPPSKPPPDRWSSSTTATPSLSTPKQPAPPPPAPAPLHPAWRLRPANSPFGLRIGRALGLPVATAAPGQPIRKRKEGSWARARVRSVIGQAGPGVSCYSASSSRPRRSKGTRQLPTETRPRAPLTTASRSRDRRGGNRHHRRCGRASAGSPWRCLTPRDYLRALAVPVGATAAG
jgi:hypothetical protein